ncbi:hypothetical protein CMV_011507 [Castanea mollissima]|uniref:Protein kinase domain-containing protein n=1 Tax=Castanea mollissima TaxID=60419 RepID=A0A8J4RKV0_9ROSI|nr:hypothetical protein CMV_011507 [Castanea mollissima]
MGCFSCFDSKEEEKLNTQKPSDDRKQALPMVSSNISRMPSGADKLVSRANGGTKKELPSSKDGPVPGVHIAAQTFTFRELAAATKNFRPESFLGEGGFGRVYKGRLESTGQIVAVKQLDRNGLQGNREFLVEVLMLSLLHHPNLVNLIGYCADGDQRLLVYDFMPLGSLEDHLHDLPPDKEPLDWNTRMKIAAGAAKVKSDVYSFGVVFLELITGRKAIDSTRPHGEQNLVTWARPLFNDRRKFSKLADPQLQGRYPMRGLYQALAVASMCIQEQAATRPLIGDVVTALSYLANQAYDHNTGHGHRGSGDKDEKRNRDERGGRILKNEEGGGSGQRWDFDGSEKDDSPRETARMLNRDLDRERAVAEAKMWGENWREKRRQSVQGSFDGNNG